MATYNKAVNVSSALAVTGTRSTNGTTNLTTPASGAYFLFNLSIIVTGTPAWNVSINSVPTFSGSAATNITYTGVVVGPGHSLDLNMTGGTGSVVVSATGVVLANST